MRPQAVLPAENLFQIPKHGQTITHRIIGEFGAARVLLRPASPGTGVIGTVGWVGAWKWRWQYGHTTAWPGSSSDTVTGLPQYGHSVWITSPPSPA